MTIRYYITMPKSHTVIAVDVEGDDELERYMQAVQEADDAHDSLVYRGCPKPTAIAAR